VGNPQGARRWHDEKRRHAPVYIAVGGGTVVVAAAVAWAGRDVLGPTARWLVLAVGFIVGVVLLALGPLIYWMAYNHVIWLELPMRAGWTGDAITLGTALEGYLSSRGVRYGSRRAITPDQHVLEVEGGLRLSLLVSDFTVGESPSMDITLSIHRINPGNVGEAEALQRTLDGWPLMEELLKGIDIDRYVEVSRGLV